MDRVPLLVIFFGYQYYIVYTQLCTRLQNTTVDVYMYGFCFKIKALLDCRLREIFFYQYYYI